MTSLSFFPPIDAHQRVVGSGNDDWGTLKKRTGEDLKLPKGATFIYRDVPIEQYYELTKLKKSHLRNNDQVLPHPQNCEMGKLAINQTFPAEHPHSSHIEQKAVFPKFAESPDDPRTGAEARKVLPISHHTPANPTDVVVVKKTKGHGERHEIHQFPVGQSLKKPLHWPGDNGFDQKVKVHGGKQQYYPAPTKIYVPNLEQRAPELQISERTANALKNVERNQWITSYDRDNTGYGTVHAMALDNMDDKIRKYRSTGEIDDKLYPRSVPVFDPARPVEGRIARGLTPRPAPLVTAEDWRARPYDTPRRMTDKEIEETRLLHGREYINLPEGRLLDSVYTDGIPMQLTVPQPSIHRQGETEETSDEYDEVTAGQEDQTDDSKLAHKYRIQQMEAENRWRELEESKPHHDVSSLRYKYQNLQGKEQPDVFYKHEGQYQEERAGLYKTSYLPEKLAMRLSNPTNSELLDTSLSYDNAINYPSRLNVEMDATRAYTGIRHLDRANNTGRLMPDEVLEPELMRKYRQQLHLQPTAVTSRPEVQENGFIGRDSEYRDHYNKEKFLQEYDIHPLARSEPLIVMSHENQKLSNVSGNAMKRSKTVHFSNDVTVATGAGSEPIRISSAPMNGNDDGEEYRLRMEEEIRRRDEEIRRRAYYEGQNLNDNQANSSQAMYQPDHYSRPLQRSMSLDAVNKPVRGSYGKGITDDMFASKSTNFMPTGVQNHRIKSSYETQFPTSYSLDFKNDSRFQWRPGMGCPRPQTMLLEIQNSFSKTMAIKDFNKKFPELHADVRAHVTTGRRHTFDGIHAQFFRGN